VSKEIEELLSPARACYCLTGSKEDVIEFLKEWTTLKGLNLSDKELSDLFVKKIAPYSNNE